MKKCIAVLFLILAISAPSGFAEEIGSMGLGPPPGKNIPHEKTDKVSMDFENAELKDILKAFSRQTGINFVASDVIEGKLITIYLNNVSIEEALSSILEANGLLYEKQEGNVYLIKPAGTKAIRTITRVYKLNYIQVYDMSMQEEDEGFVTSSGRTLITGQTTGTTSSGGSSSGYGLPGADESGSTAGGGFDSSKNIIKVIETLMSSHGKIVANRRTNSLIITDIPEVFKAIEDTIKALDVEPLQVMIQAEIIETTTDSVKRIGVEYGTETATATITYGDLVSPTPIPFAQSFIKHVFEQRLADETFTYGTLTASDTAIVLKLFAEDEDTEFLSRPRVMTINNEPAVIRVSANTAIGTESTSVSQTGTTTETAERVETGIILKVVPHVNDKGDIFMYIEPSVGRAEASTFFSSQFMDPKVRSVSSKVMVRDGDTVVIAGLIKTDNYKTIRKIPFLGDIPFIGEPFRSRYRKVEDTEILIFVTPHIIKKKGKRQVISDTFLERERAMEDVLGKYDKKR